MRSHLHSLATPKFYIFRTPLVTPDTNHLGTPLATESLPRNAVPSTISPIYAASTMDIDILAELPSPLTPFDPVDNLNLLSQHLNRERGWLPLRNALRERKSRRWWTSRRSWSNPESICRTPGSQSIVSDVVSRRSELVDRSKILTTIIDSSWLHLERLLTPSTTGRWESSLNIKKVRRQKGHQMVAQVCRWVVS
jgi:hypothetical protein